MPIVHIRRGAGRRRDRVRLPARAPLRPGHGRFLQEDAYAGDAAAPGSLHRYASARNSPVSHVDPSGHLAFLAVGAVAAVALVGIALVGLGVMAANCPVNTSCNQGVQQFWNGVLAGPGQVPIPRSWRILVNLPGIVGTLWQGLTGMPIAGGGFTSSGGVAGYAGETGQMLFAEFDIARHGAQPSPRSPLSSHHIIQNAWAKANNATYNEDAAPSILLGPTHHPVITTAQNARRDARVATGQGKWSSSLRQEFEYASKDLRTTGVPDATRMRALKHAYKYFYR